MTNDNRGWFHCGHCGRLFMSELGAGSRHCGNCGSDPSIPHEPVMNPRQAMASAELRARRLEADEGAAARNRKARARRRNMMVLKICAAWMLLLISIVLVGKYLWGDEEKLGDRSESHRIQAGFFAEEDTGILQEAVPLCSRNFVSFLSAGSPEARSQFVRKSLEITPKMARYYQLNFLPQMEVEKLSRISNEVLRIGNQPVIATVWKGEDGITAEAVFAKEGSDWKLDWEHYARYGDYPWPLFLAGQGPDKGEFRLLARRRLGGEKDFSQALSIVFYEPRFGKPGEIGSASPEFMIERESESGRLLAAAFRNASLGKRPFGEPNSGLDPDGLIRVRVQMTRTNGEKGRRFELEKVIACHWFGTDEPGVVPLTAAEEAAEDRAQAPKRAE